MQTPSTIGAYLREARLKRRVSIERASDQTRIRADFLMRMESDEFDFLAPAYVRGFLRTYARFLRVDVEPIMDEFERLYGGGGIESAMVPGLEKRRVKAPRERKRIGNWAIAAIVTGATLLALALIGLMSGDEGDRLPPQDDVLAKNDEESDPTKRPSPTPSPTPTPTPTPTPSPSPSEPGVITFDEGIELQVVASAHECWVDIDADGADVFADTVVLGGATEVFTADRNMEIVLGYPQGVELIINGQNVGTPAGENPIVIKIPGANGEPFSVTG